MRYAVSGVNDTDLGDLTTGIELLGKGITTGRVLWLRSFWAYCATSAEVLSLCDVSEGITATDSVMRITIPCASERATMVEFPSPGLKFTTDCVVGGWHTSMAATWGCNVGHAGGAGYEEG